MQKSVIPSNNSICWHWLILGGTWSVWSGTGYYMMILGQYKALVLGGTGSIEGVTGQCMMVLGQYRSVLVDT